MSSVPEHVVAAQGCPPELLVSGDFVLLRMALVDQVGFEAALLFQRIVWRSERDGFWTASKSELQAETRLSTWKLDNAIRVLKEVGWLRAERADSFNPTQRWIPLIHLHQESSVTVHQESSVTTVLRTPMNTPPNPQGDDTDGLFPKPTTRKPRTNADIEPHFKAWYAEYPKRVDPDAAERAYRKAIRSGASPAQLLDGLRSQLPRLNAVDRQFRKNPSTWLNGGCWKNEPDTASDIQTDADWLRSFE